MATEIGNNISIVGNTTDSNGVSTAFYHVDFRLSVVDAITCRHIYRARHGGKYQICICNFNAASRNFRDISISSFDSHFRLLVIIGIAVVENFRFEVGILMISVILSEMYVLPVWVVMLLFPVIVCLPITFFQIAMINFPRFVVGTKQILRSIYKRLGFLSRSATRCA